MPGCFQFDIDRIFACSGFAPDYFAVQVCDATKALHMLQLYGSNNSFKSITQKINLF